MTLDQTHILGIAIVLALGSILVSAVGFGFGLFCVPLLLALGVTPEAAVAMTSAALVPQSIAALIHLRRDLPWRELLPMGLLAVALTPVGVWLLHVMRQQVDMNVITQFVGLLLLVTLAMQVLLKVQPRDHVHPGWGVLAMTTGGVLGGMTGMGGPPIVLWAMAHQWSAQRTRATFLFLFLLLIPVQVLLLYLNFGSAIITAVGVGVAGTPLLLIGTASGLWVGNRLAKPTLRRSALIILALLGLYSILRPMLG